MEQNKATGHVEPEAGSALQHVEEALRGLRFGTVTIVVHDGAIVQVERTEKKRCLPSR
jgi:hypothetical protein